MILGFYYSWLCQINLASISWSAQHNRNGQSIPTASLKHSHVLHSRVGQNWPVIAQSKLLLIQVWISSLDSFARFYSQMWLGMTRHGIEPFI
jgi:hypothetical protein